MKKGKYTDMTQEQLRREVERRFQTLHELKKGDSALLHYIQSRGWESRCLLNLRRKIFSRHPSREECLREATAYPSEQALADHDLELYQYIRQKRWRDYCFAHMLHYDHTPESCRLVMQRFDNWTAMCDAGFKYLYQYLRHHPDLFQECCGHFERKLKYSIDELIEHCQQYQTLCELRKADPNLYAYVRRYGWEEVCFAHFADDIRHDSSCLDLHADIEGPSQRLTYKYRIPHTPELDRYMRIANNLYNQCVYAFRHALNEDGSPRWLSFITLRDQLSQQLNLEGECNYSLLPNTYIADSVILDFCASCRAFATRLRSHRPGQPSPAPPGYRPKGAMYQLRVTRKKHNRIRNDGTIHLSRDIVIPIHGFRDYRERLRHFVMATLIPRTDFIEVAIIYDQPIVSDPDMAEADYAAIDLGLDNLVAMVDQYQTTIYHGQFLKSYNQLYSDQMRRLRQVAHWQPGQPYTHRMQRLIDRRLAYVDDVMNKISRHIVDYLCSRKIGVLIVGWNGDIKNRPRRSLHPFTERMFILGAHGKLIGKLRYKCEAAGIRLMKTEECHTSKCDALALEPLGHHEEYQGRRVKRGLFRSSTGREINADVNGAINIMRKVIGDAPLVRQIIDSGHLFCPVGYKHPFGWAASKP